MKASELIVGRTYFRLTFADRDLTMPGVEPVVFLGEVQDDGGTDGFVFQDTASFVQHGSGLEGDEQHEDINLYFLPESEIGALYDIGELATEITESAQRAVSSNYPTLKPPARK
ncbi:MAG: hypothetical protein ABUL69_03090 [Peristeroidobacter soli]